mgnify:CR=1 FL=1
MDNTNRERNKPVNEMDSNISPEERALLDDSFINSISPDNENLKKSSFDNTDMEGLTLNENSFHDDYTGEGLDIPGAELDNLNEDIGEEDEENNGYSQADTE